MNTNLFRLVFSKILGMYVPVAEIATVGHKKGGPRARRASARVSPISLKSLSFALLAAFGSSPMVFAQIVSQPGGSAPGVTSHPNGTTVIDIVAPNAQGLSHNQYRQFDMTDPGVVLNNSLVDGRSSIAGILTRNPNLSGQAATTILNEINSVNASRLRGTLEVFGGSANVIIANPNGLNVNGLVTLNTPSLILSTGRPIVEGGNVSLAVTGGQITIGNQGVNTTGLQTFDLVAKLIELNGVVGQAGPDAASINAIAGDNVYNTQTRTHISADAAGRHAGYAITGDAVGAMYGRAITLVTTEAGMGVNLQGAVVSAESIRVNAGGNVQMAEVGGRNTNLVSSGGSITASRVSGDTLRLSASSDVQLGDLNGQQVTVASSGGGISGNNFIGHAIQLNANGNVAVNQLNGRQVDIESSRGDISLGNAIASNGRMTLQAHDNVNVNALELSRGLLIGSTNGDINFGAGGNEDDIRVNGTLDLSAAAGTINMRRSAEASAVKIRAANLDFNEASINVLGTGELFNVAGVAGNSADVQVTNAITLAGRLYATDSGRNLLPDARVVLRNGKATVERISDGVELPMAMISSTAGISAERGNVSITAGTIINNSGSLAALEGEGRINVSGTLTNHGQISGLALMSIQAQDIVSTFLMGSGHDLRIVARGNLRSTGDISSYIEEGDGASPDSTLDIQVGNSMVSEGRIAASSAVTIGGTGPAGAKSRPSIRLAGENLDAGSLAASGSEWFSTSAITTRRGALNLDFTRNVAVLGELMAYGAGRDGFAIGMRGDNVTLGSSVLAFADMRINASGNTTFLENTRLNVGNLNIATRDLSMSGVSQISGDFNANVGGNFSNAGRLVTAVADLQVAGDARLSSAVLAIGDSSPVAGVSDADRSLFTAFNMVVNAGGNVSNGGVVHATGTATITADNINNDGRGVFSTTNGVYRLTAREDVNNAGAMIGGDRSRFFITADSASNSGNMDVGALTYALQRELDNSGNVHANTLQVDAQRVINARRATLEGRNSATFSLTGGFINDGAVRAADLRFQGATGAASSMGNLINRGQIIASNQLAARARTLLNSDIATLRASEARIQTARSIENEGRIATDNLSMITADFNNELTGRVEVSRDLSLTTGTYRNVGEIDVGNEALLFGTSAEGLVIGEESKAPVSAGLLTIRALSVGVNGEIGNPGSVLLDAIVGNIDNRGSIATMGDLGIIAAGKFTNHQGALTWSNNATSIAAQSINNLRDAWMLTEVGDMSLTARELLDNRVGRIESGGLMHIESPLIRNISEISGDVRFSSKASGKVSTTSELGIWRDERWVSTKISSFFTFDPIANLTVKQGVIKSAGDMNINQGARRGLGNYTYNEGIILAGGVLRHDGGGEMRSPAKQLDVLDYLKIKLPLPILTKVVDALALAHPDERSFDSLYNLLDFLYGSDKPWVSLFHAYGYNKNDELANVLKSANFDDAPETAKLLSAVFGADWRTQSAEESTKRWKEFRDSSNRAKLDFYPAAQTVMAGIGQVVSTGGELLMGGNSSQDARQAMADASRPGTATINGVEVQTIEGTLGAYFAPPPVVAEGVYALAMPELDAMLANRFMFARAGNRPGRVGGGSSGAAPSGHPVAVPVAPVAGDVGVIRPAHVPVAHAVQPYYETKLAFIDQTKFYGSQYFFERVGYEPSAGIYVLGDNYFDTQLALRERSRLMGGAEGRVEGTGANVIQTMMQHASLEMASLGLEVGQPLSQMQAAALTHDIVWYQWALIDGQAVLVPRVYLGQASRKMAEAARAGGGVVMASKGEIGVETDGADIIANNAIFMGKSVDLNAGTGNASFTSTGGVQGGIAAEDKATVKGYDITVVAGVIKGKEVELDATDKLTIVVGMEYDSNGNLVKRNGDTQLVGTDQLTLKGKTVELKGASLETDVLNIKAGNLINSAVQEVSSEYQVSVDHALGETFAFMSQSMQEYKKTAASEKGVDIKTKKLNLDIEEDVKTTGGRIDAKESNINVGGQFLTAAAKTQEHVSNTNEMREMQFQAALGAGGSEAGAHYGTQTGGDANVGRGKQSGTKLGLGFSMTKGEKTTTSVSYQNAELGFGTGTVKVEGIADLGGANINSHLYGQDLEEAKNQGTLDFQAASYVLTKYENTVTTNTEDSRFDVGIYSEFKSSLFDSATNIGDMVLQAGSGTGFAVATAGKEEVQSGKGDSGGAEASVDPGSATATAGKEEDQSGKGDSKGAETSVGPGLAMATAAKEGIRLASGNVSGIQTSVGAKSTSASSSSIKTEQNQNYVGGNAMFTATKGDMEMAGVNFGGGDVLKFKAAGEIKMKAAKSTTSNSKEHHDESASLAVSLGSKMHGDVGLGGGVAGSSSEASQASSSTTWTNAQIAGNKISFEAGSHITFEGVNVMGEEKVQAKAGGKITTTSLLDEFSGSNETDNWAVGFSYGLGPIPFSPTLKNTKESGTTGGKVVNDMAGIMSAQVELIAGIDPELAANGMGGIEFKGALLEGEEVKIKGSKFDMGVVEESYSQSYSSSSGGIDGLLSVNAKSEQSAKRTITSEMGSDLIASKLIVDVEENMTVHGGSIKAAESDVNVGGKFVSIAAKTTDELQAHKEVNELQFGASIGLGGYEAEVGYGTESGLSTKADRGKKAGINAKIGFSNSTQGQNKVRVSYENAELDFGVGTVKVAETADVGGANINGYLYGQDPDEAKAQGKLYFQAADFITTKFENSETSNNTYSGVDLAVNFDGTSSIANTVSRFGDMGLQAKEEDGREVDVGLAAAMAGTELVQTVMTDTAAANATASITASWGHSDSGKTAENLNYLGGNIQVTATEGDAVLVGVKFGGGDEVGVKAAGEVKVKAAKSTTQTSGEDHSVSVSAGIGTGVNALQGTAGSTGSATVSGSHMTNQSSATQWTNSTIAGNKISIESGGNTTLEGANIEGEEKVKVKAGGKVIVDSLQDTLESKKEGGEWAGGVAVGGNARNFAHASPTIKATYEQYTESGKMVNEQSGIKSNGILEIDAGDNIELTGATLAGATGHVKTGGQIISNDITDTYKRDGGKGGLSVGVTSSGAANITGDYGRAARDDIEVKVKSTIDFGDEGGVIEAEQGIEGKLNFDSSKTREIVKDERYAGGSSAVTMSTALIKKAAEKIKKVTQTIVTPGTSGKPATAGTPGQEATPTKIHKTVSTQLAEVDADTVDGQQKPSPELDPKKSQSVKVPGGKMKVEGSEPTPPTPKVKGKKGNGGEQPKPPVNDDNPIDDVDGTRFKKGTDGKFTETQFGGDDGTPDTDGTPATRPTPDKKVTTAGKARKPAGPPKTSARYMVQENVNNARETVKNINMSQDKNGKLVKPQKISVMTPDGKKEFVIHKREDLLKLNGTVMAADSTSATGVKQYLVMTVKDVGGKNYSVSYRTYKGNVVDGKAVGGSFNGTKFTTNTIKGNPGKDGTPGTKGQRPVKPKKVVTYTPGTPDEPEVPGSKGNKRPPRPTGDTDPRPATPSEDDVEARPGSQGTAATWLDLPDGTIEKPMDVSDGSSEKPLEPKLPKGPVLQEIDVTTWTIIPGKQEIPGTPGTPAVEATPDTIETITSLVKVPTTTYGVQLLGPWDPNYEILRLPPDHKKERPELIDADDFFETDQ